MGGDVTVGRHVHRPLSGVEWLRETEVQDLDAIIRRQRYVARLQIPMDDAFVVRRFERLGDLFGNP